MTVRQSAWMTGFTQSMHGLQQSCWLTCMAGWPGVQHTPTQDPSRIADRRAAAGWDSSAAAGWLLHGWLSGCAAHPSVGQGERVVYECEYSTIRLYGYGWSTRNCTKISILYQYIYFFFHPSSSIFFLGAMSISARIIVFTDECHVALVGG